MIICFTICLIPSKWEFSTLFYVLSILKSLIFTQSNVIDEGDFASVKIILKDRQKGETENTLFKLILDFVSYSHACAVGFTIMRARLQYYLSSIALSAYLSLIHI